jgi:secreted trypsin-like serine protease
MLRRVKALLATAAAFAILVLPSGAGAAASPRVVGGSDTAITATPYQVALFSPTAGPDNGFFCGGVIYDTTHVLTAAHCVFDDATGQVRSPSAIHVLAGTNDLDNPGTGTDDPVRFTSFDPSYDPSVNDYDVAVLTLVNPLSTSASVATIPLIGVGDPSGLAATGKAARVSGWGDRTAQGPGGTSNPDYPNILQSAQVHVTDKATCVSDYASIVPVSDRMVCADDPGKDSCFGDSGGPLVVVDQSLGGTSPANYVLAGLVDSGYGCAQPGFPGIYNAMANASLQAYLTSSPPQAPQQQSATTISGNASSGQTATCNPGAWGGGPTFAYEFFQDLGDNQTPRLIAGPITQSTYLIKAADVGSKIFCVTKATAAGGYGYGLSDDLAGSTVTSPPPTTVKDTSKPTLSVARKSCSTRGRCVVNVQVSDRTPSSGIADVAAKLRWRAIVRCHKGSRKRCMRTKTKTVKAKSIGGGHYLIVVSHLSPRTYGLILRAADKAGNHQRRTTYVTLRVKAKRRS